MQTLPNWITHNSLWYAIKHATSGGMEGAATTLTIKDGTCIQTHRIRGMQAETKLPLP